VAFYSRHLNGDRRYDAVLDGSRPLPGVPSRASAVPVPRAVGQFAATS
jgi:hypothetical protein